MNKSINFVDNGNCPITKECIFYNKDTYNRNEVYFYADHCLNEGNGCGMKTNHDLTERLKEREKRCSPQ